jgi:hypothetical protein
VHYVASTFDLVLNWLVESNSPLTVAELNGLFRALAFRCFLSAPNEIPANR